MTTLRTSAADVNRLSVSNNVWGIDEGSDRAWSLDAPPTDGELITLLQVSSADASTYSSLLKICDNTHDISLSAPGNGLLPIPQGMENALDINNRVANVTVLGEFGLGGFYSGDQVITVKGGSHDVKLWGIVYSTGRNADIVCGAWSDQCFDSSYNLDFSGLVHKSGEPLTFVLARCRNVKLPPGAKVLRWKSLCYSAYWWTKWAAVKLGVLK